MSTHWSLATLDISGKPAAATWPKCMWGLWWSARCRMRLKGLISFIRVLGVPRHSTSPVKMTNLNWLCSVFRRQYFLAVYFTRSFRTRKISLHPQSLHFPCLLFTHKIPIHNLYIPTRTASFKRCLMICAISFRNILSICIRKIQFQTYFTSIF